MEIKGEYVKDTFAEYLSKKHRASSSDLKTFLKSPLLYYYNRHEKVIDPTAETERHYALGSACHELILEPQYFSLNYLVMPKFDRRTKEGKENYNQFMASAGNKEVVDEVELTMLQRMVENAMKNETFIELIKDSHRELSFYTTDPVTGLELRLRPDSLSTNKSTATDIKTCLDSSPKAFKNDVYRNGYSLSAAFYSDFLGRENYVFAAIEKKEPYQIALYQLSDEMLEYGRQQYRMALDLLKWSIDNNYWCNYNEFEILKECYELQDLGNFFEARKNAQLITILR